MDNLEGWLFRIAHNASLDFLRDRSRNKRGRPAVAPQYAWIFAIQALAYYGKLAIHPTALTSTAELWQRAAIGPIPGTLVMTAGVFFHGGGMMFGVLTLYQDRRHMTHYDKRNGGAEGRLPATSC